MKMRQKCNSKGNKGKYIERLPIFCAIALFILLPSSAISGEPLNLSDPKCNCSVEKGKDGQEEFILTGQGCKTVAEDVKKAASSQTKAYSGSNCVGMCSCTWHDNLGKNGGFICRGCCREILTKM
jgi:hypothetical protein